MGKACSDCDGFMYDYCGECLVGDKKGENEMMIKDSGERREFSTGAVRDIQTGKGRCDLMPLDVVASFMNCDRIIHVIGQYQASGDIDFLYDAMDDACALFFDGRKAHTMLEVSKHFEAGAAKYGEYNWQMGIPEKSYIDSAIRHYLKAVDGQTDERHDLALLWNLMCLIWTKEQENEFLNAAVDLKIEDADQVTA